MKILQVTGGKITHKQTKNENTFLIRNNVSQKTMKQQLFGWGGWEWGECQLITSENIFKTSFQGGKKRLKNTLCQQNCTHTQKKLNEILQAEV